MRTEEPRSSITIPKDSRNTKFEYRQNQFHEPIDKYTRSKSRERFVALNVEKKETKRSGKLHHNNKENDCSKELTATNLSFIIIRNP